MKENPELFFVEKFMTDDREQKTEVMPDKFDEQLLLNSNFKEFYEI